MHLLCWQSVQNSSIVNVGHSHGSCCALQCEKHTHEAWWERMRTAKTARKLHTEIWLCFYSTLNRLFFPVHTNKVLTVFSKSSKKPQLLLILPEIPDKACKLTLSQADSGSNNADVEVKVNHNQVPGDSRSGYTVKPTMAPAKGEWKWWLN